MTETLIVNSNTYTDDADPTTGMANGGFRTRLLPMLSDTMVDLGKNMVTTSTTSVAIGTGSKAFTMAAAIPFAVGAFVEIASEADGTNWMWGQVTARTGTSLTVDVQMTGGSGTLADWNIHKSGVRGATGDVAGPGSSTDNALVRWDGTGGVAVQSSAWTLADGGALSGAGDLTLTAATTETRQLQIGHGRAGDGTALIDLVGDTTYGNYGARLVRLGSTAGETQLLHRGTGSMQIRAEDAAEVRVYTDDTLRMTVGSDGAVSYLDNRLQRAALQDTAEVVQALGTLSAGTTNVDLTAGNVATLTGAAVAKTFTVSNWPAGLGVLTFLIVNGGLFSSVTWPVDEWVGGAAPDLTASGYDAVVIWSEDGGTTVRGSYALAFA